ncbi:YhjD/YihY/BrkB family envelope integrity protein [Peribacillus simplex]|uniref:YhjD/YihY/BrkB family envelope integrity protein n=1 Tax=Peribacillus simplex TaxID=1478 RepID=UPI0035CD1C13
MSNLFHSPKTYAIKILCEYFFKSATYGSLDGIIVLMIWFYLSGLIIIIVGEINAFINEDHPKCE